MNLGDLQTFIGSLCNDTNHDRYSLTDINTELDNTQDDWNLKAKIIKDTVSITLVANTRQYALSNLTGTPISFPRVTHKGIDLNKRSKAYFDHLTGYDWTADIGTPRDFYIEAEDPDTQYFTVRPVPQSSDVDAPAILEYIKRHTPMSASTDVPFMSGTSSNYLLRPFDWGVGYATADRLLRRDPSNENAKKADDYKKVGENVLADVIQVFKQLEAEEPKRMRFSGRGVVKGSK